MTSDKDYYQLIDEKTKIWSPNKRILIDSQYVLDKWKIMSENFCLARCFAGDQSDGLKGVKGAGFKVMAKRFPDLSTCKEITCYCTRWCSNWRTGTKESIDSCRTIRS